MTMDQDIKFVKLYPFKSEDFKIPQKPSVLQFENMLFNSVPPQERVNYFFNNLSKKPLSDFEVNNLPVVEKELLIYSVDQLIADMQSKYVGLYPKYWVCKNGGLLSHEAVIENFWHILDQFYEPTMPQWHVIGCEINSDGKAIVCSHTGKPIS